MWPGQKKDGKTGFGSIRVSEKLFVGLFSRAVALRVFKFGEKGFGTGTAPGIGGATRQLAPPAEYITSENTIC